MEYKDDIKMIKDKMIELYGKLVKIKYTLDICENGKCDSEQVIKDEKIKKLKTKYD